ncbi:hypothetical protein M514_08927 [Trichuris suis]|uniref:Uncharacterized protein n=1 Tax=Trichuris suis TaxID=68888 RepID=A0A085NLS3_9BILA|nr:hypothetical protein M513_08927 [Trichuris suis]KFD70419.1 hypothetical protein M514_08927 [Trichuris suis]
MTKELQSREEEAHRISSQRTNTICPRRLRKTKDKRLYPTTASTTSSAYRSVRNACNAKKIRKAIILLRGAIVEKSVEVEHTISLGESPRDFVSLIRGVNFEKEQNGHKKQRFMEDFEEKQFSTADSCILDKHLSLEHCYGPFRRRSSNGIFNKINLIAQFGHFE